MSECEAGGYTPRGKFKKKWIARANHKKIVKKLVAENQALKEQLARYEQAPEFKVGDRVKHLLAEHGSSQVWIIVECWREECTDTRRRHGCVRIKGVSPIGSDILQCVLITNILTKLPPDPKPEEVESLVGFREQIEQAYIKANCEYADFGEILCYELHSQPVNPRMRCKTSNDGFSTGLTFKELAEKWGISVAFLGELIADHCKKL